VVNLLVIAQLNGGSTNSASWQDDAGLLFEYKFNLKLKLLPLPLPLPLPQQAASE